MTISTDIYESNMAFEADKVVLANRLTQQYDLKRKDMINQVVHATDTASTNIFWVEYLQNMR